MKNDYFLQKTLTHNHEIYKLSTIPHDDAS